MSLNFSQKLCKPQRLSKKNSFTQNSFELVSVGILSEIQLQVLSEASDLAAYHAQARSESRWGALRTLCRAMWGETIWQTQASTSIATFVERRLGKQIDRNHGGLFQKRHSTDWMDCSKKSSGFATLQDL